MGGGPPAGCIAPGGTKKPVTTVVYLGVRERSVFMTSRQGLRIGLVFAAFLIPMLVGCREKEPLFDTVIVVKSTPVDGAEVFINTEKYGVTPCSIRGLPPGPVLVEVTLEGYKRAYDTYRVPDHGSETFTLSMERLTGEVSIHSEPSQAEVYLNGRTFIGVTPITAYKLPAGTHTFELRKDKYEPYTATLDVQVGYKYSKRYDLTPRASRLEVYSSPSGASIWINNQIQREKTPARIVVRPGTYSVSVYTRGYVMAEEIVTVEPGGDAAVHLRMNEGTAPPGMLLVPGGEFVMGVDDRSPDERPKRTIYVEAFYIDKYEVTNEQFKAVFPTHVFAEGEENYPVAGVSWEEATAYAQRVKKRLPTEEEWEKAARGTDAREYPWGNLWDPNLANVRLPTTRQPKLTPVGEYLGGASPYGCLDMAGNVYEWTSSWYAAYPGNQDIKKEYGQVFRVLRGGSFDTAQFDARCARRHFDLMNAKRKDYGFRCAMDVEDTSPRRP